MEAQTVLGSLVCFPNLYAQIPILQHVPGSDDIVVSNEDIKVNVQHVPYWIFAVNSFKNKEAAHCFEYSPAVCGTF